MLKAASAQKSAPFSVSALNMVASTRDEERNMHIEDGLQRDDSQITIALPQIVSQIDNPDSFKSPRGHEIGLMKPVTATKGFLKSKYQLSVQKAQR